MLDAMNRFDPSAKRVDGCSPEIGEARHNIVAAENDFDHAKSFLIDAELKPGALLGAKHGARYNRHGDRDP